MNNISIQITTGRVTRITLTSAQAFSPTVLGSLEPFGAVDVAPHPELGGVTVATVALTSSETADLYTALIGIGAAAALEGTPVKVVASGRNLRGA